MSKTKNHPAVEPLREEELAGRISDVAASRNCASHAQLHAAIATTKNLPGHDAPAVVMLRDMLDAAAQIGIGVGPDAGGDANGEAAGWMLGFALYFEHLAEHGVHSDVVDGGSESNPAFVAARQGAIEGLRTSAHHVRILARMVLEGLPPA